MANFQIRTLREFGKGLITIQHWDWFNSLTKEERDRLSSGEQAAPSSTILRRIFDGQDLIISKCSGKRTIAQSGNVFSGYLDLGFKQLDVKDRKTPKTKIEVFRVVKNATFDTMFRSLGRALNTLVFTQDQVITFVEEHRDRLQTGGSTNFFLLNKDERFFVASVYLRGGGGLEVRLFDFVRDGVWNADDRLRVVVPQLQL